MVASIPPRKVVNADVGDADHVGGDDWDIFNDWMNDVDCTGPVNINTLTRFRDGKLTLRNPANTFTYTINTGTISADRSLVLPAITGADTLAVLGLAQTFTEPQKIAKNTNILLTQYRATNTVGNAVDMPFDLNDSVGNETQYGRIKTEIVTNTDGAEDGNMKFAIFRGGTQSNVLELNGSTGNTFINDGTYTDLLYLYRQRNTATDTIDLNYDFQNSASSRVTYCDLRTILDTNTAGAEDASWQVQVIKAGNKHAMFRVQNDTIKFGDANLRAVLDPTGLTAQRTYTFPDVTGAIHTDGDADNSFRDNRLRIWNPADTFRYTIVAAAIAADRTLNLPLITGTDTLAVLGLAQTFTAAQTVQGLLSCGGANARITFDDTIESASRTYNFPDIQSWGGQNARVKVQSHDYFEMEDEFTCGSISTTNTSNQIGTLNWGISNSTGGTPTVTAGVTSHPGIVTLTTGATSGNNERMHLTDAAATAFCDPTDIERISCIIRIPTVTTMIVRFGIGQDISAANFGTAGAWFNYDASVDTHWQSITRQASTSTTNTTTDTVTATNWYLLEIRFNGTDWEFYVNNTLRFTHSTNKPTTACNIGFITQTSTTAARPLDIDYFKIRTKKLGQRWT